MKELNKHTLIVRLDRQSVTDEALVPFARMLAEGKTVAFPTETVYGLGADATNPAALSAIFEAKGRPSDNPLIVHVAEKSQVEQLTAVITPLAETLMTHFWPGPLTIILKKAAMVPDMVTAGLDTVALRMPAHPLARRLIALSGVPVAAPSANRSGKPSPTLGAHVIADLQGRVDAIIDGGPCMVGLESTVVDATGTVPVILRPGGVTREMLEAVVPVVEVDPSLVTSQGTQGEAGDVTPRSPGMKYTHYAPRASMIIAAPKNPVDVCGLSDAETISVSCKLAAETMLGLCQKYHDQETLIGMLCADETAVLLRKLIAKEASDRGGSTCLPVIKEMGSFSRPEVMASTLFQKLREFDNEPVTLIIAQRLPETAMGFALMNRLMKAAGYREESAD